MDTPFPIRAAFTYPWKPRTWYSGVRYTPWLGAPYDSGELAVIRAQMAQLEYGKFNAGIASWWGRGDVTDLNFVKILSASMGTPLQWTLYYEPALGAAADDLDYVYAKYGAHPNYLHVGGKPVLFVYNTSVKGCNDVGIWEAANKGRFYLNFQVFGGYTACPIKSEGYHQYGAFYGTKNPGQDHQKGYSFSVCPGFWKWNEPSARFGRDPKRFEANVAAMVASAEPWQLVISLDEQGEGTGCEPALDWQSASGNGIYLDILHNH